MKRQLRIGAVVGAAAMLAAGFTACGNGSSGDSVTVAGDVPVAYVKRASSLDQNPTDGMPSAPGGDLIILDKSSPSASEHNVTAQFTQGKGDVSDPEASYDGKKIAFAMTCPKSNTAQIDGVAACTGRWNIWEYDMSKGGPTAGSFRRLTSSETDDDADPAYLPAGAGFVFSSNRQTTGKTRQAVGSAPYFGADEYERERVMNLHTMTADGGNITQISVNQSHDRNPVVRPNGDIMFSRWEHVGPRNRFAIFTVKPDGTNMFVHYGAQSPGNSFLHPRDMDPNGPYKGFVASDLMSLSGTHEGGALMFIDVANYSENQTPINSSVPKDGGQKEITAKTLNQGRGLSEFGRITSPYPLWDGTNRVLVAWQPCRVMRNGVATFCADLTDAEKAMLSDETRSRAQKATDPVQDNAPTVYGIYMFDPAQPQQQGSLVATPPAGFMYTDPIALQARAEPNAINPTPSIDPASREGQLATRKMGLLAVRSVYDTDGLGRMGEGMLGDWDHLNGCSPAIALTTPPSDLRDTRAQVADLVRMKDPADSAYRCAPARFVRAVRAVAPPQGALGVRKALGETDFEQQQIIGYAPIEPDGSFELEVPADVPLGLAVVDAKGRGIQTHLNWIQVRPGEVRTCDGCHSPRRGASLNSGTVANTVPSAWLPSMKTAHGSGETMAATRTKLNPASLSLGTDMISSDVWADPANGGTARPSITISYEHNANPADNLATAVPQNGIINYPTHIAPIWSRTRALGADPAGGTCTACHNDPTKLDLRATLSGTGRVISYEELMVGDPVIDTVTGLPSFKFEDGVPMIERGPALVETMSGNASGHTRSSRLGEIMFGDDLLAQAGRAAHPTPTTVDHTTLLNLAEKRVIAEWMDLGGQYYNDPFAGGASFAALSETVFDTDIQPILRKSCASNCHQAKEGSSAATPAGTSFTQNRFVLTGSAEGDYNVTLSMISDTCTPGANYLLSRPSTNPHPAAGTAAVLPSSDPDYTTIANWILSGCR